jgi:hypothetical protein
MAILNISEALRLFRFDNELDSSSCMSQVDCPKSKKLPTLRDFWNRSTENKSKFLRCFWKAQTIQNTSRAAILASCQRLLAKSNYFWHKFGKVVIDNMETVWNERKKIKWSREPCRAIRNCKILSWTCSLGDAMQSSSCDREKDLQYLHKIWIFYIFHIVYMYYHT